MSKVVLDASALLAHVQEEPGWEKVERRLHGALMSTVNYSEVLKKTIDKGGSGSATAALVRRSQVKLVDFSAEHGLLAAELWPMTRTLGLSLADRACLALGMSVSATVLTADRRMAEAILPIKIVLVRDGH